MVQTVQTFSQIQHIDEVVDVSVVMRRPVPTVQSVQKSAAVPQTQHIDEVVHVPTARQRRVPTMETVHETGETPQIQYVDNVVDVPAGLRRLPLIQKVLKAVKVAQVQDTVKIGSVPAVRQHQEPVTDRIVDVPAVWQHQLPRQPTNWPMSPSWNGARFPPFKLCQRCHRFSAQARL